MGYDNKGRWGPDEDFNWKLTEPGDLANLRTELTKSGLDWRHQGKYAFELMFGVSILKLKG